jgi:hypothetical protein
MKTAIVQTDIVIAIFKKALGEYQEKVKEQPTSTFYKILVKNTEEFITKLKSKDNGIRKSS